ncbi:hypothetical protein PRIPAC_82705, partial [Pristionchus pacificus]|uniref:Uncharacterized protein n=1 Tax=Pristionchus pacificus TaxID=54126 RepID=A0A2A6BEC2_PRIPA
MIYRFLLISALIGLTLACAPNAPIHPNLDPSKGNQENTDTKETAVQSDSPMEGSGQTVEEATEAATESPVEETTEKEPELLKEGPAPHQVITQLSQEFRESMKDWTAIVDKLGVAAKNLMRANGEEMAVSNGEDEEFFRNQAASHFRQRVDYSSHSITRYSISAPSINNSDDLHNNSSPLSLFLTLSSSLSIESLPFSHSIMGMHPSMMALTVAGIIYILWKAQGAEACMPGNLNQGIHGLPTFKDTQETKTPPKPSASAGTADEADTSDKALSRSRTMARGSKTITEIINDVREKTEEELELELKAKLEELERKRKEREKEEEDAEKVADGTKNDGGEIKPENEGSGHGADAGGDKSDGHVSEVTLEENKQPTLKVGGSSIQTTIRRYNRRTERREISSCILLLIYLVNTTDSCLPSGSSYSNRSKSVHGLCGPLLDAIHECSYLNEEQCKLAIKTKTRISCGDSQGMFLKGDRDFFPITRLICDVRTQLWMIDGENISVNEKVGYD